MVIGFGADLIIIFTVSIITMDDIQRVYREKLTSILELQTNARLKSLLISGLISEIKEL